MIQITWALVWALVAFIVLPYVLLILCMYNDTNQSENFIKVNINEGLQITLVIYIQMYHLHLVRKEKLLYI